MNGHKFDDKGHIYLKSRPIYPKGIIDYLLAHHWFDKAAFARECQRILTPGGYVVLLWNVRDENNEIVKRNSEVNAVFSDRL